MVEGQAAPQFTGTGIDGYNFRENQYKQHRTNNWTLDNNATKIWGKHEFQFGGHFRQDRLNILPDQTWKEGMLNFSTNATATRIIHPVSSLSGTSNYVVTLTSRRVTQREPNVVIYWTLRQANSQESRIFISAAAVR